MKQEVYFDPNDYQDDPEQALTLAVRQLRLGGKVKLDDGSMVVSRVVQNGARTERKFAVIPSVRQSSVLERHRALHLRQGVCNTPSEAARKALEGRVGKR